MMYTSFETNFYCGICFALGIFTGWCLTRTYRNLTSAKEAK
jgi:hypothetical protein